MIKENVCMSRAALTCPASLDEASARVAECMNESELGVIGSIYSNYAQFADAMSQAGWRIVDDTPIIENEFATTWSLECWRKIKRIKVILNSFGDHVQVMNVQLIESEAPKPKTPPAPPIERPAPVLPNPVQRPFKL